MRLEIIEIENFRCFKHISVNVSDYACLVGPNGAGKSTVLSALNVFFRHSSPDGNDFSAVTEDDFHCRDLTTPIRITLTFGGLSDNAKADLGAYVRSEKLIVSTKAELNGDGAITVTQHGNRMGIRDFARFFAKLNDGEKVSDLKNEYTSIRQAYIALPQPGTKDAMINALHEFENSHPALCETIESNDQFYGFTKGSNLLAKHIQYIFIPAVKDPKDEGSGRGANYLSELLDRRVGAAFDKSALEALKQNTLMEYSGLVAAAKSKLTDVSSSLQRRLEQWAHPDASINLQWHSDEARAVRIDEPFAAVQLGEHGFTGMVDHFGHGLQRSYLLALLEELMVTDTDGPSVILAFEEPELFQHPPQLLHLSEVLSNLADSGSYQIILCTHSPLLLRYERFEDIRLVRRSSLNEARISSVAASNIAARIAAATGKTPLPQTGQIAKLYQSLRFRTADMFFCRTPVLVEGVEDEAYIASYMHLAGLWKRFRSAGCHIVPVSGKNELILAISVALEFSLQFFALFDADGAEMDARDREKNRQDNTALLSLLGESESDPFPANPVIGESNAIFPESLGKTIEFELADFWNDAYEKATRDCGGAGRMQKNGQHIARRLKYAWEAGGRSESLQGLCERIITKGSASTSPS